MPVTFSGNPSAAQRGTDDFLPKELLEKCFAVVSVTHKQRGFDKLAARVVTRSNMPIVGAIPSLFAVAAFGHNRFRVRRWCWVGAASVIILAWLWSWWFLAALVFLVAAERKASATERETWMLVAAGLLAVEVLAMDFAGWGTAFPSAKNQALCLIEQRPLGQKITWLHYYFPQRGHVNPSVFAPFAPERMKQSDIGQSIGG